MAKGYWLALVDVSDPEGYKAYVAAIQDVLRTFGGRYVIRAGRSETMEGKTRSRLVTIEFKDYETALGCYRSPDRDCSRSWRISWANFCASISCWETHSCSACSYLAVNDSVFTFC